MTTLSRRATITAAATLGVSMAIGEGRPWAAVSEVRFDFTRPFEGWETVTGKWAIADVPGASQGGRALVQHATNNAFNVIVAPGGPYTDRRAARWLGVEQYAPDGAERRGASAD